MFVNKTFSSSNAKRTLEIFESLDFYMKILIQKTIFNPIKRLSVTFHPKLRNKTLLFISFAHAKDDLIISTRIKKGHI